MGKVSAGILVYRITDNRLEVLLAHPGGPYWAKKDDGAWSIFKGEQDPGEELLETAKREFREETQQLLPDAPLLELGDIFRKSDGKTIHAWAVEADYDAEDIRSNMFETEWPPKSGTKRQFPENDRAQWCTLAEARQKLYEGQYTFVERLVGRLHKVEPGLQAENPD